MNHSLQPRVYHKPDYDLAMFENLNWARNVNVFHQEDAANSYWITAMVEELGELAGAVKKLDRGFNTREFLKVIEKVKRQSDGKREVSSEEEGEQIWRKEMLRKIAYEGADVFIYLLLFCTKNNVNLWEAIKFKFNQVSAEMNCPEYEIK